MIKLLGVITKYGSRVTVKMFTEVEEEVIPKLVSATRGISKVMGVAEIKSVDFGEDTLLLTESRKEYT